MTDEIEPIPAEQARAILEAAIRERLGETWEDEEDDGWVRVSGHDYMARLTDGRTRLDFYVDLLGEVTIEEQEIGPEHKIGGMLAWMALVASMLLALVIAYLAGYL
jgi:hypothetical protein